MSEPTTNATSSGNAVTRWLGNRTVNTKILMVIAVMGAAALTVGALSIDRMSTMNATTQELYYGGLEPLNRMQTVLADIQEVQLRVLDHVASNDDAAKAKFDQLLKENDDQFAADVDSYAKDTTAPDLLRQLRDAWAGYLRDRPLMLAASREHNYTEIQRLRDNVIGPEVNKTLQIAATLVQAETDDARKRVQETDRTYRAARTLTIIVLCVGILLALAFGLVVARTLATAVQKVTAVVAALAAGDLTRRADVNRADEVGQMATGLDHAIGNLKNLIADFTHLASEHGRGDIDARVDVGKHQGDFRAIASGVNHTLDAVVDPMTQVTDILSAMAEGDLTQSIDKVYAGRLEKLRLAVNNMISRLAEMVGAVIESAEQINTASSQISGASQGLSQAASEQAASVEETTASIEQMGAGIAQNSENATATESIATKAAADATEGGAAVEQTVEAMKQIASKIGIIDDIAFQTNMLALNATIEAARAGEHGKGFAVVATEVGKLAERSQVAAQEISGLAAGSVQTAERAGALLREMVPSITKTSDLVQEIAAASGEQANGARQIDTAMSQVSKITQQNASSSEELAATAEELAAQTAQLQSLMGFFTTTITATATTIAQRRGVGKDPNRNTPNVWTAQNSAPRRDDAGRPDADDAKFVSFTAADLQGKI